MNEEIDVGRHGREAGDYGPARREAFAEHGSSSNSPKEAMSYRVHPCRIHSHKKRKKDRNRPLVFLCSLWLLLLLACPLRCQRACVVELRQWLDHRCGG